jgi:hypothetical protein
MNALVGRRSKTFLGKRLRFFALVHITFDAFRICSKSPTSFVFHESPGQYRDDLRDGLVDSMGKFLFFGVRILLGDGGRIVLWMPQAG